MKGGKDFQHIVYKVVRWLGKQHRPVSPLAANGSMDNYDQQLS